MFFWMYVILSFYIFFPDVFLPQSSTNPKLHVLRHLVVQTPCAKNATERAPALAFPNTTVTLTLNVAPSA